MITNEPPVSDTWLASYGGVVYTPKHRAGDVLAVCRDFDEGAHELAATTPKGYTRIAVNVNGWKQRDALHGRLNFAAAPRISSNILFHPALLEVPAPRKWIVNVIPLPSLEPLARVHDLNTPQSKARRWAAALRMAAGKADCIPAGCAVGTTDNTMRKRADSAAAYVFELCQQASGDERGKLAYAGGLLLGAAHAADRRQIMDAAAAARRELVSLHMAANVRVIEVMRTGEQAA